MSFSSDMMEIAIAEACEISITESNKSDKVKERTYLYKEVLTTANHIRKKLKSEFPGLPAGLILRDWNVDKADKFPVEEFASGKSSKIDLGSYDYKDYANGKESAEKQKEFVNCLKAFLTNLKAVVGKEGTIKKSGNAKEGTLWFVPGKEYK